MFSWQLIRFFFVTFFFFLMPVEGLAQDPTSLQEGISRAGKFVGEYGLSSQTSVTDVVSKIILDLLMLSALLAMGALVWGGIMYILSLGNDQRAEKAKRIIWYSIIGVTVILASYAIIAFTQNIIKGS